MAVLISCNEVRQRFEVVLNREFFFYWLNEEFNVAVRQKDEEVVLHVDNAGDIMWGDNEKYRPSALFVEQALIEKGFTVERDSKSVCISGWS